MDINFNLSDAEIVVNASTDRFRAGMTGSATVLATDLHGNFGSVEGNRRGIRDVDADLNNSLMLKRQREFDIDAAQAEWRVADGVLVVLA